MNIIEKIARLTLEDKAALLQPCKSAAFSSNVSILIFSTTFMANSPRLNLSAQMPKQKHFILVFD